MAAEARRKCSGNLQVPVPQEVHWKPPLRQAATTLSASLFWKMHPERQKKMKTNTETLKLNLKEIMYFCTVLNL